MLNRIPSTVLAVAVCIGVLAPPAALPGESPEAASAGSGTAEAAEAPRITVESLAGRSFRFYWKSDEGGALNDTALLKPDGTIEGIRSPNESTWKLDDEGRLLFLHSDGRVSTRYERVWIRDGGLCFEGPFLFREGIVHSLVEVLDSAPGPESRITPEEAGRIRYSRQRFVYLDPGEAFTFRLRSGEEKTLKLESVEEVRDRVVGLVRRADVVVTVDGQRLELVCAPYAMPTEIDGLRVQADTTSAWLEMPGRVQLSVWDAADPIVDTSLLSFPLPGYRLFSHGIQAYNEPVHLGHRDGDPAGQKFHHDYGMDLAGYEGRQKVVSCIAGTVLRVDSGEGTLCIEDDRGVVFMYGHLDAILSEMRPGVRLERGQWVGMLGKRGASGNFSHLHVGVYLSGRALLEDRSCRNLNLYPWLVMAYLEESGEKLCAVARPHRTARTGDVVTFDGSRSLAVGGNITSYRWVFHDGAESRGPRAERVYERPGCYSAALWVEDAEGRKDVDFTTVRVYSRPEAEDVVPTIFATFTPCGEVHVGSPVHFRLWPQGRGVDSLRIDFGDGTALEDYVPYSAVTHIFRTPGIHVVKAAGRCGELSVMQQVRVEIHPP